MSWPLALLAALIGLGLWVPQRKDRRLTIAVFVVVVVLAVVYVGLGSAPSAPPAQ